MKIKKMKIKKKKIPVNNDLGTKCVSLKIKNV